MERARCYVLLGQRKTAVFDFSSILKEHPDHVQALCGRGFTYLMLNQQKVLGHKNGGYLSCCTCSASIAFCISI